MEKIILNRGMGKTSKLIKISEERNLPIICFSFMERDRISRQAKAMGTAIPHPISINELPKLQGRGVKEVLVDEADLILNELICRETGAEVQVLTMTAKREPSLWGKIRSVFRK